jgi:hypothetical protein
MLDFCECLANDFASCLPPVLGVLLHPRRPKMMERIVRLADSADVSAKVEKDGLYGAGSGIDAEE